MILWLPTDLLPHPKTAVAAELEFGVAAPVARVIEGRNLFREDKGADRALLEDRIGLGEWFDGRVKRVVDSVVWLSPPTVARWYGWLAERDGWSDVELDRRWKTAAKQLGGHLTFVVRLASFPKVDIFRLGNDGTANPDDISAAKFRLVRIEKAPSRRHPADTEPSWSAVTFGEKSATLQKDDWAPIANRPFYADTQLAPLFLGTGETAEKDDGIPLGDYYGAVYMVTFPMTPEMTGAKYFEFDVRRKSKVEKAIFSSAVKPLKHDRILKPAKKDEW